MNLYVVLTCHNRKEKTINCLKQLHKAAFKCSHNIDVNYVVCDDMSTDGTVDSISQQFPDVIIVHGSGDLFWARGMACAMNAIELEETEFYLMVNDDVTFYEDSLQIMLDNYIFAKEKDCAIVGSTRDANGNCSYGGLYWNGKAIKKKTINIIPNGELQLCNQTNWNCFLIPRELYLKIGKIDDYYEHSAADYDYANRITNAGYHIYVASDYVGTCERNAKENTWQDSSLSVRQRIKLLHKKTGVPMKSNWHYCSKFYGIFAPVVFLEPYKGILKDSFKSKKRFIFSKNEKNNG